MSSDLSRLVDMSKDDVIVNSITSVDGTAVTAKTLTANNAAPSSVTTTTTTLTAAILLTGYIVNSAASAVTATTDTAANIVAALNANYPGSGARVGDTLYFEVINGGSSSGAITVAGGTGCTFDTNVATTNKTVAINTAKTMILRVTNATPGSEAVTLYI